MKVCYLLPKYQKNSAENFYHIINFLEEFGKKVELYVLIEHGESDIKIQSAKQTFILNNGERTLSHFLRFIHIIKIYFYLYNKGINIFFARASLTGVLPLIFANRFLNFNRAKIIFWSCGIDVIPLSFFPNINNIKRLLSKVLIRFVFLGMNYLATGPEKMASYYHQKFNIPLNKILTLYNDISFSRFFPLSLKERVRIKNEILNSQKKIILFVHTFNKSRGADILPSLALEIKKKNINAVVIAIGRPGDYSFELESQIKKNNLENSIINLGQVPNNEIEKFYQISDLFVMPSSGEGFPRVMLESMACKCPTLAFDVGGVSEVMNETMRNELLIPLDDRGGFINQAVMIIDNMKLLNKLANASYSRVKKFSTENIIEMYINSLSSVQIK
jgi:glycosyltransferase involved in cell wall biosynthesis